MSGIQEKFMVAAMATAAPSNELRIVLESKISLAMSFRTVVDSHVFISLVSLLDFAFLPQVDLQR